MHLTVLTMMFSSGILFLYRLNGILPRTKKTGNETRLVKTSFKTTVTYSIWPIK